MAQPISLDIPAQDEGAEARRRVEQALTRHADAVVAALELLQGLHDRGLLTMARDVLGSGDRALEILLEALRGPESIRAMRNGLLLVRLAGAIEPQRIEGLVRAVQATLQDADAARRPVGLGQLLRAFGDPDFRRGLGAVNRLLRAVGANLARGENPTNLQ